MMIVEDGSVVDGADSFLSLLDARELASKYGIALDTDDTKAEQHLRAGFLMLANYERTLSGSRVSAMQCGIFPRVNCHGNGFLITISDVPLSAKLAQLYAAEAIADGYKVSTSDHKQLSGFSVDGVYSEAYQASTGKNREITGIVDCLRPFRKSSLRLHRDNFEGYLYQ